MQRLIFDNKWLAQRRVALGEHHIVVKEWNNNIIRRYKYAKQTIKLLTADYYTQAISFLAR